MRRSVGHPLAALAPRSRRFGPVAPWSSALRGAFALGTVACVALVATLMPTAANAQADQKLRDAGTGDNVHRVTYTNLTVIRLNPLGLQNRFEIDYRFRMYDPGASKLLANNFIGAALQPTFTPAGLRLGAAIKWRPLNILKIELRYEFVNFFGNFDMLQSFDSPNAEFSDTTLDDNGELDLNYGTKGQQFTIDTELRFKFGPVVVRSRLYAGHTDMEIRDGDTVWYSAYYDLMLPKNGWFFVNDLDVLVQPNKHLTVGVRWKSGYVPYQAQHFAGGLPGDAEQTSDSAPTHAVGPLFAWTFFNDPGATFNKPTAVVIMHWYLKHRWRTGADVSQAIPYTVFAFAFTGDLL